MNVSKKFLLDSNPFIEAKNRHYGFDIVPGFWSSLIAQHELKRVESIDRVRDELIEQDDEIKEWIDRDAPETFFKKSEDQNVIHTFQEIVRLVYAESQYTSAAKAEFADVADGWVIAYAHANDMIIVTHEEYAPEAKRKVPMPNICVELNVEYINTFEMLRRLEERFIRSTKRRRR